ncbi:hypothetical protein GJ744_012173 [Endocarpon pusillum]|uniref:Uncharacterized protein n=1 Tax=Endocarpon pusillum TaxID=364733 RepID=A0A8H7ABP8_9EURO|nr:hypothetical protein GJ744_012173 [Endocarpon pusillum]
MAAPTVTPTNALPEKENAASAVGYVSKPIDNTLLRRTVARLAIKCLTWRPRIDTVTFWTSGICYEQTKDLRGSIAFYLSKEKSSGEENLATLDSVLGMFFNGPSSRCRLQVVASIY